MSQSAFSLSHHKSNWQDYSVEIVYVGLIKRSTIGPKN